MLRISWKMKVFLQTLPVALSYQLNSELTFTNKPFRSKLVNLPL